MWGNLGLPRSGIAGMYRRLIGVNGAVSTTGFVFFYARG
jgi:hypothetical protein